MAYRPICYSGAFFDSNADPIAGATVTITIRNAAGTAVVTNGACTERTGESGSYYEYVYTPVATTTYTGVMSTTSVSAVQSWLLVGSETGVDDSGGGGTTAQEVWEYATRTLTSGGSGATAAEVWSFTSRSLTSPTLYFDSPFDGNSEDITLIRGDSYSTGDSDRPLQWSGTNWPVLTGGSIALLMRSISAPNDVLSFAGTVVDADTAQVVLTAAQTGAMDIANNRNQPSYDYALVATLADGEIVTLVRGNVTVRRTPANL